MAVAPERCAMRIPVSATMMAHRGRWTRTDSVECANDGFCFSEEQYGILGGYCGDFCNSAADCGEGFGCEDFGRFNMCTVNCEYNSDCRDGYVCYPSDSNPEMGMSLGILLHCWVRRGSFCNQYGLCGDEYLRLVKSGRITQSMKVSTRGLSSLCV